MQLICINKMIVLHGQLVFFKISPSCIVASVCVDVNDCQLRKDDAGLSWDAVSFTFLLIMSRVYKTWYFQHVVTDLKVDNKLASR